MDRRPTPIDQFPETADTRHPRIYGTPGRYSNKPGYHCNSAVTGSASPILARSIRCNKTFVRKVDSGAR